MITFVVSQIEGTSSFKFELVRDGEVIQRQLFDPDSDGFVGMSEQIAIEKAQAQIAQIESVLTS